MTKGIVRTTVRHGLIMYDKHVAFYGSGLSNFYNCRIEYHGKVFRSSEQLFMYLKAVHFGDELTASLICAAETPRDAKYLGRKVKGFKEDDWIEHRQEYMEIALMAKFMQNPVLKELILDPEFEGKHFVEGSPSDKIWGVGIHYTDPRVDWPSEWQGKNLLGQCLDNIRAVLREAYQLSGYPEN